MVLIGRLHGCEYSLSTREFYIRLGRFSRGSYLAALLALAILCANENQQHKKRLTGCKTRKSEVAKRAAIG